MTIVVSTMDGTKLYAAGAEDFDVRDGFCVLLDAAGRSIAALPSSSIVLVEREGAISPAPPPVEEEQAAPHPAEALARYVD